MDRVADQTDTTFPIRLAQGTILHARALGFDVDALLRTSGIDPRLLDDPFARISAEHLAALQLETISAMDDEGMGYHRIKIPLGTWAMMCKAVIHCESLGQAVNRYSRFFSLFDFSYQPKFTCDSEWATISFEPFRPDDPVDPFPIERGMFRCHRFLNWLVCEDIPLTRVNFSFGKPPNHDEYRDLFLGADVSFGTFQSSIVFPKSFLQHEIKQSAASLAKYLREPVLSLFVSRFGAHGWTSRVMSLLKDSVAEEHDLTHISGRLSVHPQTLRRRLHEEGTSFKDIRDRMRRDLAIYHLGQGGRFSIEDIAFRCGFSETSAFIRAFQRWTGYSPSAYRLLAAEGRSHRADARDEVVEKGT